MSILEQSSKIHNYFNISLELLFFLYLCTVNYSLNQTNKAMANKRIKVAAILMLIHGALMEAVPGLLLMPFVATSSNGEDIPPIFAFEFFRNNLALMLPMAVIFGVTRVIGAVGVLRNRKWGFILSVINCVITMNLMLFMIPAGIADGILTCTALVLLLSGYFRNQKIIE